jgi:hypothetical protein
MDRRVAVPGSEREISRRISLRTAGGSALALRACDTGDNALKQVLVAVGPAFPHGYSPDSIARSSWKRISPSVPAREITKRTCPWAEVSA